jgi:gliding motility-associated-like protein
LTYGIPILISLKNILAAPLLLCSSIICFGQKSFLSPSKDIFGTRVFVENKGQFDQHAVKDPILFAYENGDEHIYFTRSGLIHEQERKIIYSEREVHERAEKAERGREIKKKIYKIKMDLVGVSDQCEVTSSDEKTWYLSYGDPQFNSRTFTKIIYKNVYPSIDIEYLLPEEKDLGIKYNIILRPGSDPSLIELKYSGDVKDLQLNGDGTILVQSEGIDLIESAPISFLLDKRSNQEKTSFILNDHSIKFNVNGFDGIHTYIIDPWVTPITSLSANNYGYDVDYDYAGNLYVHGGTAPFKVAKYNSSGVLQWTFSGVIVSPSWNSTGNYPTPLVGNFIVQKTSQKTYIGQGWVSSGTRTIRLDQNGNYDNFITPAGLPLRESWDFGFNCSTGELISLGGHDGGTNSSGGVINQINGNLVPTSFYPSNPGSGHDIVSGVVDDSGILYIVYASVQSPALNNKINRVTAGYNNSTWLVPTGFATLAENDNKGNYVGSGLGFGTSNGFNCLGVTNNYLYYYDGFNLAAYNKTTGAQLTATTIPGQLAMRQGGIAIDDCENVYIGGNGTIRCYNYNGTSFTPVSTITLSTGTPNQYVYDLKLDKNTNKLFVAGSGFVGTYSAISSLTCSVNQFSFSTICSGNNNATAIATITTNFVNPQFNYIWSTGGTTISTTFSTSSTSNTVNNLANGIYTLQIQVNAPCGPILVNTVSINCTQLCATSATATAASCSLSTGSASITSLCTPSLITSITWSPTPGSIAGNSLSASGMTPGVYTISVYNGTVLASVTQIVISPTTAVGFSINSNSGSYSITCNNPTLSLIATSNYTLGPLNYTWSSIFVNSNTPTVNILQPQTVTVIAMDPFTGCASSNTITVGSNTIAPTASVAPLTQAINCTTLSATTISGTVISPTVNFSQSWYGPINPPPAGPPLTICGASICPYLPTSPGVYTNIACNMVNGCCTANTVTITSLSSYPTFSLSSPTNFSIGCPPLNQTTVSIINPVSTQTPPATCSFAFLPPSFTGTPAFSGAPTSTVIVAPGVWTIIVQDNSNNCKTAVSIPIIQNTLAPNVSAVLLTQTLTCANPTLLALGTSSTPNTYVNWQIPVPPPLVSQPTVIIGPGTGPNTSTTSLAYASFTVIATNSLTACQNFSIVVIDQNFFPPISSPTISMGTPTAIYCNASINPVVLTNGNSTTTSNGGPLAFAIPYLWQGPSPQQTISGTPTYSAFVPGTYTLTIMDNYNGCLSSGTIQVIDQAIPPVIQDTAAVSILDCGSDAASLVPVVLSNTTGLMYWYYAYPSGAAFSPTAAPTLNSLNSSFNGTPSNTVFVSLLGQYYYVITNTLTGCKAYGHFLVEAGQITSSFTPSEFVSFAPANVDFTNNSFTSLGNSSITSVWSFGNGTSNTNVNNLSVSILYEAPGTYSVWLIVSKGNCIDSSMRIIKVEIPSDIQIPNIFTPNGDGINDAFFCRTKNITEINALIFDRWGNKVYETHSETGNILWDGRNFNGKECSAGVYLYLISAKGKDDKEYSFKGNVTLLR